MIDFLNWIDKGYNVFWFMIFLLLFKPISISNENYNYFEDQEEEKK